jgi:hypothetical protein
MVSVRVVKIVDVVDSSPVEEWVAVGWGSSVMGHTVVEATMVSVVTNVVLADAGQLVTVEGHAVTVAVRVVRIVEVVEPAGGGDGCLVCGPDGNGRLLCGTDGNGRLVCGPDGYGRTRREETPVEDETAKEEGEEEGVI